MGLTNALSEWGSFICWRLTVLSLIVTAPDGACHCPMWWWRLEGWKGGGTHGGGPEHRFESYSDIHQVLNLPRYRYLHVGDLGSIPGLGRSLGEGNGNPLQYSHLENPMDGGAWWATVHSITKGRTWLSDFTFTFTWSLRPESELIIKLNHKALFFAFLMYMFPWRPP